MKPSKLMCLGYTVAALVTAIMNPQLSPTFSPPTPSESICFAMAACALSSLIAGWADCNLKADAAGGGRK